MSTLTKTLFVTLIIITLVACSRSTSKNKEIELTENWQLKAKKTLIENGDAQAIADYEKLIKKADSLLTVDAFSVTKKTGLPPSKSKHDYMSIGPYWWPNPETDDGLPYIRKDGEINPETRNNLTDYVEKDNFFAAVKSLKNSFYFSGDKIYANKNLDLINKWFIDDATKMKPNLNFGQSIPGKNDGRCFGIIEFGGLVGVIEFLELAKDKNILSKEIENGMFNWFSVYSDWLKNSKLGKEEATRKNNHATYYDVQLLSILLYLNKVEEVKNHLSTTTKARIFSQIEPNGSQPLELARTKSFSYSVMNLHGFLELAILGQKVGVNLWDVSSKDGRSIKKGYEFMLPYLLNEKKWQYIQIEDRKHSEEQLISDLISARKLFKDNTFDKALHQINQRKEQDATNY